MHGAMRLRAVVRGRSTTRAVRWSTPAATADQVHGAVRTSSTEAAVIDSASDPAVQFYPEFEMAQTNYHDLLVQEAHRKHNVPLNIPPQMNPGTDLHIPVYCSTLGAKMQEPERHFAFAPLHGPPPRLPEMEPKVEKRTNLPTPKKSKGPTSAKSEPGAPSSDTSSSSSSKGGRAGGLSSGPNPLQALITAMAATAADTVGVPSEPAVVYSLPTDEDIDSLVVGAWDNAGKKALGAAYVAATSFSVGHTDPEQASKDGISGTTLASTAAPTGDATAAPAGATNPLASQMARASLTTGGFTSPFVTANNFATPMPDTHTTARLARKFQCGLCSKSFRLFDAVMNHYQLVHDCEPTAAKLAEFKSLDNPSDASLKRAAEQAALQQQKEEAAAQESKDLGDPSSSAVTTELSSEEKLGRAPIPTVDVSAHIRAPSNIVLVGQVRELQFGFVEADPVAQLLVQVDTPATNSSTPQAEDAPAPAETEYITVRCFGEHYADVLKPSLEVGGSVVVHGTLKLNFHHDKDAGEAFPFPYVKVVPPFGDVAPLGA